MLYFLFLINLFLVYRLINKQGWLALFSPSTIFVGLGTILYFIPYLIFPHIIDTHTTQASNVALIFGIISFIVLIIKGQYDFKSIIPKLEKEPNPVPGDTFSFFKASLISILIVILMTIIYFCFHPYHRTALFSFICNPEYYMISREYSVKLVKYRWLAYLYGITYSGLCIFAVNFSAVGYVKKKSFKQFHAVILSIIVSTLFFLISGAKVGWIYGVISIALSLIFILKFKKYLVTMMLILPIPFIIPAIINNYWTSAKADNTSQICQQYQKAISSDQQLITDHNSLMESLIARAARSRAREELDLESTKNSLPSWLPFDKKDALKFISFIAGSFHRILIVPITVGGWYLEHYEENGLNPGLLFDRSQPSIATKIAIKNNPRLYGEDYESFRTASTPVNFMIKNILYFGWYSIIISIIGIFLLDFIFILSTLIRSEIRISLMGVNLYYSLLFLQSAFGTTILTHGYFLSAGLTILYFVKENWRAFLTKNRP